MKKYLSFIFAGFLASGLAIAGEDVELHKKTSQVDTEIVKTDSASTDRLVNEGKRKDKKQQSGKYKKESGSEHHVNKLAKKLDLTEGQTKEIGEIRKRFEEKNPKPDFHSMTKEERISWYEANKGTFVELKKELGAVLTPEQKEKAKAFYKKKAENHQKLKERRASKE